MKLPAFTIEDVGARGEEIVIEGVVSAEVFLGHDWMGDDWLGYVGRAGERPVRGRWIADGARWRFVTDDRRAAEVKPGELLCFYDMYWGERADLVLAPHEWTREEFRVKGGWDHEHCDICWGKMDAEHPVLYRNGERDCVCRGCYEGFVVPRSLAFIVAKE